MSISDMALSMSLQDDGADEIKEAAKQPEADEQQ